MSDWKKCTLGDMITLQRGHDLPKKDMVLGSVPVAGSNGIIGYHNKSTTQGPGVTIGRSGNLGNAYFYKDKYWAHNTTLYVKEFNGNDEVFTYYFLKNMDFKQFNVGSAVPTLNRNHIHPLKISIPSLPEQKAIAGILRSLDDKIDLLQRHNQILEALAETLFRKWFVEESEDHWEEKSLSDIADYLNGLACQKYPPKNEADKLPVLKIKELRGGISDSSDWSSTDIPNDYIVQNGDVIFSWSGSLLVKIWDGVECILNQHLFKVTSERFPKWLYYLWTKYHLRKFISIAESKSTTMGHIRRKDLSDSMVFVPEKLELGNLDKQFSPIFEKIVSNNRQTLTLIELRNTLLPKLMSGKVRVNYD